METSPKTFSPVHIGRQLQIYFKDTLLDMFARSVLKKYNENKEAKITRPWTEYIKKEWDEYQLLDDHSQWKTFTAFSSAVSDTCHEIQPRKKKQKYTYIPWNIHNGGDWPAGITNRKVASLK